MCAISRAHSVNPSPPLLLSQYVHRHPSRVCDACSTQGRDGLEKNSCAALRCTANTRAQLHEPDFEAVCLVRCHFLPDSGVCTFVYVCLCVCVCVRRNDDRRSRQTNTYKVNSTGTRRRGGRALEAICGDDVHSKCLCICRSVCACVRVQNWAPVRDGMYAPNYPCQ